MFDVLINKTNIILHLIFLNVNTYFHIFLIIFIFSSFLYIFPDALPLSGWLQQGIPAKTPSPAAVQNPCCIPKGCSPPFFGITGLRLLHQLCYCILRLYANQLACRKSIFKYHQRGNCHGYQQHFNRSCRISYLYLGNPENL